MMVPETPGHRADGDADGHHHHQRQKRGIGCQDRLSITRRDLGSFKMLSDRTTVTYHEETTTSAHSIDDDIEASYRQEQDHVDVMLKREKGDSRKDRMEVNNRVHASAPALFDVRKIESSIVDEEMDFMRERVEEFFQGSECIFPYNLPKFDAEEIVCGRRLGRGGSCDVYEIPKININCEDCMTFADPHLSGSIRDSTTSSYSYIDKSERSEHVSVQLESRRFIAKHCKRASGDARYAIKRLRADVLNDDDAYHLGVADLVIETRILYQLEHPHVVKVRGIAGCDPFSKRYFIMMDRLYETLHDRLCTWYEESKGMKKQGSFIKRLRRNKGANGNDGFFSHRLEAARDLTSAIDYLHEKKIIHRDLKPENVGFDVRGDIKIFDFGLARDLSMLQPDKDGCYKLSNMTGSLRYMAPEVILGEQYNEACDVYSLCILVWEMLNLERPYYKFKKERDFISGVAVSKRRPPLRRHLSKTCKDLFQKGWNDNHKARLNVKQVMAHLESELEDLEVEKRSSMMRRRSTFVFRAPKKGSSSLNLHLRDP